MRGVCRSPFRVAHRWTAPIIVVLVSFPGPAVAQAPTTVLHTFRGYPYAVGPAAPLMQASDSSFYGTTYSHGRFHAGTVFRRTPGGTVTTLYEFPGDTGGAYPNSALVQGPDGALYGTTGFNFSSDRTRTLFRMTLGGEVSILHRFDRDAEGTPGQLMLATDGFLYGTTTPEESGLNAGTVFRMTPGGAVTVLHAFAGGPTDGSDPRALVQGADGSFYGITASGGTADVGTLFRMTPSGAITILHSFLAEPGDGAYPWDLIQASNGSLYGLTSIGPAGYGTLFEWTPGGQYRALTPMTAETSVPLTLMQARDGRLFGTTPNSVFTISSDGQVLALHTFDVEPDGLVPQGLVQGADGRLYGTTTLGGISDFGTVFRMELDGAFTVLHRFLGSAEGAIPRSPLVEATDGNFYGTTGGGLFNAGTIFRMTPGGAVTTLHTFTRGLDGAFPSSLIQASDGFLYGTTSSNGASNQGTIFRISTGGAFTVRHAFAAPGPSGGAGALVQAADGHLYGITRRSYEAATVFRMTLAGTVSVVHQFNGSVEGFPIANALIQGTDGGLYGISDAGVFRVGLSGGLSMLYANRDAGADGMGSLVQAADGNFYGVSTCAGEIFRLSPAGAYIVVVRTGTDCSDSNLLSFTSLTVGRDGTLYGTISNGNGLDSVFSLTWSGELTPLHQTPPPRDGGRIGDATAAPTSVTQARNGMLYATTADFGHGGTIFRVNITVPLQPMLPMATPTAGGVRLTWAGARGATSFRVTRRIGGGPAVVIASGLTTTTFTDARVMTPDLDLRYSVVALNASGQSLPSVEIALPWGATASQTPTISTVGDYDGDGHADLTVYRSTTGQWFTAPSATSGSTSVAWGGGRPVPADYDGDGRTDVAIYNAVGQWFIRRSNTFPALWAPNFGAPALGDLPIPADYDGDGKADLAVYRTSTGEWFVLRSTTNTVQRFQWGGAGDLPVPADYDGDGRADIAVYRSTTGEWFIERSATGTLLTVTWGAPSFGDVPMPADYDGDGHADLAVYRATTGEWFVADATGQPVRTAWGAPTLGDVPVPADYDGDGETDLAVFRLSTGEWFIRRSAPPAHPYDDPVVRTELFGAPAVGDAVRSY